MNLLMKQVLEKRNQMRQFILAMGLPADRILVSEFNIFDAYEERCLDYFREQTIDFIRRSCKHESGT